MGITKLTKDVAQVSKLGDYPRTDNGLSTNELKAWFDKAPIIIKEYLNGALVPELDKKFGEIDRWIDTYVAASKDYVDKQVRNASPYNLLDNSDFRNPVNQRGANSYYGTNVYCVDRWNLNGYAGTGTIAVTASGVKLTPASDIAEISQKLERSEFFTGKSMTFAVKILGASSPNILNVTFGTDNSSVEANGCTLIHWKNDSLIRVLSEQTIEWAALYEGTYTAETLPEYQPKGYAVELAECQRYFQRIDFSWQILAVASPRTAATTRSGVILPQMPRISAPTCTYSGSNAVLASTEGNKIITELKPVAQGNIMRIECTAESVTAGMPYAIYGNSSSEYIDISADL